MEEKAKQTGWSALKAIRAKCLDCCCGNVAEVTRCPCTDCPLYIYRDGHNPARKGLGGKGNAEALRRYREEKRPEGI